MKLIFARFTQRNPLINRNFALLWFGQTVSQVGDTLFNTTLVLWIATLIAHGTAWAPLAISGALLAASLPGLLIQPLAGVYVDRWNKRQTMIRMDSLRMALILLLMLLTAPLPFIQNNHLALFWRLGSIYLIVFLVSTCAQFFNPSTYTLLGDIVPEKDLTRAFGLNQVVQSIATIVGPAIAGFLVFGIGVQRVLLLNALSFAISCLSILAIRVPQTRAEAVPEQRQPFFQEFREGVHFLLKSKVLRVMSISVIINMIAYGTLNALDIFFVTENLHVSTSLYGFLGAAAGVGAIVGALLANRLVKRLGQIRTSWLMMLAMGIFILAFARQTSFLPALVLFALFGAANAISIVAMEPLTLQSTPRALLGRVSSVIVTSWTLALLIATALAGYLDSTILSHFQHVILSIPFHPVDTLFTLASLLLIASGIFFWRQLRDVTLTQEPGKEIAGAEMEHERQITRR